jgi:TonB family protein
MRTTSGFPLLAAALLSASAALTFSQTDQRPLVIRKSTGVLQNEALQRVEPVYPPLARAARVGGRVPVEIKIDEDGLVYDARALSGHPLLKDAALSAARQWKFKPTLLSGTPVKVIGTITFNFQLDRPPDDPSLVEDIEELEKQVRVNPGSYKAQTDLGRAYHEAGRDTEAIACYKEAIRIQRNNADAYCGLALVYMRTNRDEDAEKMITRAVEIQPDKSGAGMLYWGLGMLRMTLKKFEEGLAAFTEAVRRNPDEANGHYGMGMAFCLLQRYEAAISSLKRALEISPEDPWAHFWLGRSYLLSGDRPGAIKEHEILKKLDEERAAQLLSEIRSQERVKT